MYQAGSHPSHRSATRTLLVLLLLVSPVAFAGMTWIPTSLIDRVRHTSPWHVSQHCFEPIERAVQRDSRWVVLDRSFHPAKSNWSLVLWHDSHLHPDQVDPDEVLVLEYLAVSEALVATMRVSDAPPAAPLDTAVRGGDAFTRGLRGDLTFRSQLIGRANRLELFVLVDQLLDHRVREIHQPAVSLTSALH
ncbi:MAG: hypothetical protein CBC35_06475 [Planctomycetes bacterium TMED75]|nr:MAG: hypothetical protein CBC35_06475 [Planctomycetes bacterium TMED75]